MLFKFLGIKYFAGGFFMLKERFYNGGDNVIRKALQSLGQNASGGDRGLMAAADPL